METYARHASLEEINTSKAQLYWLTDEERSDYRLADDPRWPGLFPEAAEMQRFVETLRKESSRQVECRFDLSYAEIPGMFDLVTGEMLVVFDGEYRPAEDFPARVGVRFEQVQPFASFVVDVVDGVAVLAPGDVVKSEPMTLGQLLSRPHRSASYLQVNAVVERLDRACKLPAVEVVI